MRLARISWQRGATLALLLALIVPILAACGGTAPTTTEQPTAAAQPTAAPAPTAMPEPTAAAEPTAAEPTAATEATAEPSGDVIGGVTTANNLMVASVTACDAEYQGAKYAGLFKEIAAVDPLTVKFTMCAPDPAFKSKVAFSSFAILPSEQIESTGGTGEILEKPIGTGPYIIDSWARGDNITLTRNDNYWGEKAKAGTLSQVAMKLGEALYKAQGAAEGATADAAGGASAGGESAKPTDDGIVDADFEEVKDDKKKK